MNAQYDHCRQVVRDADRDRYLAALYAPAAHRPALYALYAFNTEIARVRDLAREPMPGEIRLQWWREVIEGERGEEAKANPVAAAMLETLAHYDISRQPLIDLIEARSFDLYDDPMPSVAALEGFGAKTETALIGIAAGVLTRRAPDSSEVMAHAGMAMTIATVLRRFALHAARRQLYVPMDIVERYGASRDDIIAGKATSEIRAALADMRVRARSHLSEAGKRAGAAPPEIWPALLTAALVRQELARMERHGYQPFQPDSLPQWRRQWLLWRAARDPQRIFA